MPKSINQRIASIEDWLIQRSSTLIPHVAGFRHREWQGYLLALSMVATATLIRFAIAPIYGGIPYLAYFPAVTLTAIFGGLGPSLLAGLISLFAAAFLFLPPYASFSLHLNLEVFWSSVVFAAGTFLTSIGIEGLRRYQTLQNQLSEAQRLSKTGSWSLDFKTGKLEWSDETFRIFEIDPADFRGTYEAFIATVHPDDRHAVSTAYQDSLAQRSPSYEITHRLSFKDGRIKHVHECCETLYDRQGNPTLSRGTCQDVSEQHRIESELRRSKQLNDSVIENIPNMMFMKRISDLRFVLINKAGEDLIGISGADILGKNDYDLFPKEQADFFTAKDREVIRHGFLDIPEEVIETRNLGRRILHTRKIVLRDSHGEPEFLLGLSSDITERMAAKNRLRLHSEILLNMQEGVQITRVDDEHIVYATPRFEAMFGYAPGTLTGRHVSSLNAPGTHSSEAIATRINQQLLEEGQWRGEIENIRKDGSTFWCWVNACTFDHHEYGKVWVAVHEDITARKLADFHLRQARDTSHRELLVREVHHRIKNNLQGIIGVLRQYAEKHPLTTEPINQAVSQVQSIAVIHGLQGRSTLSSIRLCELTSAIASGVESLWRKPVTVDIPDAWTPCLIKESEAVPLALVLNELISNAVKHDGDTGPITVTLRHEPGPESIRICIYNQGQLPADFVKSHADSTGLQLVHSLLPRYGAQLSWHQQGDHVVTVLELDAPAITLEQQVEITDAH